MAFFNYPFHIAKNTPAVANETQSNFDSLLAWIMANVLQKDGTNAATGPVVLPPGPPGAPDQAANKAYVDAVMPVGTVMAFAGTVLPSKWLWCDGVTYTETSQQPLFAAIARSFTLPAVPTGSFSVPNLKGKFPVGADVGEVGVFGIGKTGGQRNSELFSHQHNVSAYSHTATGSGSSGPDGPDHYHTNQGNTGDASANHTHISNGGHSEVVFRDGAYNTGYAVPRIDGPGYGAGGLAVTWGPLNSTGAAHYHGVNRTGSETTGWANARHTHTITVGVSVGSHDAKLTDPAGAGTALIDKNLPPFVAVNYIIYAGA